MAVLTSSVLAACGLFGRADPTVGHKRTAPSRPSVVVLDHGSSPRTRLRYRPTAGTTGELELRTDVHLTQRLELPIDADGSGSGTASTPVVVDPPATIHRIRFTVTSADDRGHDLDLEVIDASIDPQGTTLTDAQLAAVTAEVRKSIGWRGTARIDPQGVATSLDPLSAPAVAVQDDAPSGSPRTETDLSHQLATLIPPLPTQPVGRGARWRVTTTSPVGGTKLRQVATYEITSFDGGSVLYRATIQQDAGQQVLSGSDRATTQGGSASDKTQAGQLIAAHLSGTTTGRFDLDGLRSESETHLTGSQLVDVSSEPARRVRQEMHLTSSSGPAPS